jgi:hypothetical protein
MVFDGTKALDKNVNGKSTIMEIPGTLAAVRAMTPKNAKIQLTAHVEAMTKDVIVNRYPKQPVIQHEINRGPYGQTMWDLTLSEAT